MKYNVGQRMLRVSDGMVGVVTFVEGDTKRITYTDRGEHRLADRKEEWIPKEQAPKKMRREEMLQIAQYADGLLRSIDKHEPFKFWEPWALDSSVHDPVFFDLIVGYLQDRK